MQVKSVKHLFISVITISMILLISGCGKSGNRFANRPPTIEITSFEGWNDTNVIAPNDTMTFIFQQRIYWHATDPDGIISGFAFRILDENGNPISTRGYDYIDSTGVLTPENLVTTLGTGWVIHYMPGADQNIPLDNPQARRSIWTSQKYAVINFPAADAQGNPIVKFSKFEVVAIDNRGDITSEPAWRDFRTRSDRPKCTASTTKGNPNGKDVGSGLKLSFSMKDTDPYITSVPYKYEFKLMKLNPQGAVVPGTETEWFSTTGESNRADKINEYLLTKYTQPAITYDYVEENGQPVGLPVTKTRIISRVMDMAGVLSIPDSSSVLAFYVCPGFRPHTFIYPTKTYALTNYHFEDYGDDNSEEIKVIPKIISEGTTHFAIPLFKDMQGNNTAVYSSNIKLWIRWGWWGEYVNSEGVSYGDTSNLAQIPYNKKVDVLLDSRTGKNYFSEVTAFDIRLDGQPYNYPPYPFSQYGFTDNDGTKWLRLPVNSPLGQTVVLTSSQLPLPPATEPGEHKFEVRIVDLQDEYDPTPVSFTFFLHRYIEPANRSGILVIDDDVTSNGIDNEKITDQYTSMLSDYDITGTVDYYTRSNASFVDIRSRALAFSDLQKYKLVIYHNDNFLSSGNLLKDFDGLSLYLMRGGNLVMSHTHLLVQQISEIAKGGTRKTFVNNLGFSSIPQISFIYDNMNKAFFQKAIHAQSGYSDMNLQYDDPAAVARICDLRDGLGSLSYFENSNFSGEVLFKFGCKPVTATVCPPSAAFYNEYNDQKTVAFRRTTSSNGKVYVFGFPLSYMKVGDESGGSRQVMNKIISEVM
ncbi:MAG: hypothetical protein BWY18_00037 [Candidatus Cloacimonetes bacterium ADurb.Bin211]|nr:MAG: hypothetical protein BWY18_00037 [Candidatus Cloacimonetes bacterium ADurb.Bin211]